MFDDFCRVGENNFQLMSGKTMEKLTKNLYLKSIHDFSNLYFFPLPLKEHYRKRFAVQQKQNI